jgi:hypothetical protein
MPRQPRPDLANVPQHVVQRIWNFGSLLSHGASETREPTGRAPLLPSSAGRMKSLELGKAFGLSRPRLTVVPKRKPSGRRRCWGTTWTTKW